MKPLNVEWSGIVKFSKVIKLNDDDFYLRENLVQHTSERGKKSHFTVKEFLNQKVEILPKDTEIEFTGYASENNYKDKEGNYQTKGLEIIATEVVIKEVFDI